MINEFRVYSPWWIDKEGLLKKVEQSLREHPIHFYATSAYEILGDFMQNRNWLQQIIGFVDFFEGFFQQGFLTSFQCDCEYHWMRSVLLVVLRQLLECVNINLMFC